MADIALIEVDDVGVRGPEGNPGGPGVPGLKVIPARRVPGPQGIPGPLGPQGPTGANGETGASGAITTLNLVFSTTITEAPAVGEVRLNSATQNAATKMWISLTGAGAENLTSLLTFIVPGYRLTLQDKAVPATWQGYAVNGPIVVKTGYIEVPVAWMAGGAALTNALAVWGYVFGTVDWDGTKSVELRSVAGVNFPVLVSTSGRAWVLANGGQVLLDGTLQTPTWGIQVVETEPGGKPYLLYRSQSGKATLLAEPPHDPMDASSGGSSGGSMAGKRFTAAQYAYAQGLVVAERKRMASVNLSLLKRVLAGIRIRPRTGQSFEARDNLARLYLNELRIASGEFKYHAACVGPDLGGVDDELVFETYDGDSREFWFCREQWAAGTGTDRIYTPAEITAGSFTSNSRGGGPAPLSRWARQWLRQEWLQQSHATANTAILDVVGSAAKSEGSVAEVFGTPGRDRSMDFIRVVKEARALNTRAAADPFRNLLTLPSLGADIGIEMVHILHGQNPNTAPSQITPPNPSYLEAMTAYIEAIAAYIADPTTGIGQTAPFAVSMMQPGAIGWSNTVNECARQMVDIAKDVTGAGKYFVLAGAMWDLPSKKTLPVKATFSASISGTTMTVTAFTSGDPLAVGDWITTYSGLKIIGLGTGTGGVGTYTVNMTFDPPNNLPVETRYASYDPDALNGHPLQTGNIYMGCREGIVEHYVMDRNENFWPPIPMNGFYENNKFLLPISTKFPGLHAAPICIGVEPTVLPHLGFSFATPGGTLATITSIDVVPGMDLVEGTVEEDSLAAYTVGQTGRYDGLTYFGVVCMRDGMTSNLPIKVAYVEDQRHAINGYIDDPTKNHLGRYAEDIPGVVGEIDWGNPVMINTWSMSAIPV